jgi:large subunit ribosomal protein L10
MKTLLQKKKIVDEMREKLLNYEAAVLIDYRGLKVRDMTELRRRCREHGVDYQVVKNTLTSLSIKETPFASIASYIVGPTALGLSHDPVVLARIFVDFSKEYKELKIKALSIGEEVLVGEKIKELAALPERDLLLRQMLFSMMAPIYGLMNALRSPLRGFLNVLKAIESKKED